MDRVTATFDRKTLREIRRIAGPRGVSGFLQEAARQRLAQIRMTEVLDELDEKYGKPSDELRAEIDADGRRIFGLPPR